MSALELPQKLRLIRFGKISFRVLKTDEIIGPAMHDQDWNFDFRQLRAGIIFDRADPPHRQPRKKLGPDVRNAGERALQNQPGRFLPHSHLARHSTTERFAK